MWKMFHRHVQIIKTARKKPMDLHIDVDDSSLTGPNRPVNLCPHWQTMANN